MTLIGSIWVIVTEMGQPRRYTAGDNDTTPRWSPDGRSLAFVRAIDQAAACMYELQHEVLAAQGIPVQGIGREAYRS